MRILKMIYNAIDAMSYLVKVMVLAALVSACSSTQSTRQAPQDTSGWLSGVLDR